MIEPTTPAPGTSCIDDVAPGTVPLELVHLRNRSGQPITVHCVVMNRIELITKTRELPGLRPPPTPDEQQEAIRRASKNPELLGQYVYPIVIAGAFLVDRTGELVRPTFSLEEEPGRICVRRVHDEDLFAIVRAIQGVSVWSGGPAERLATFPTDTAGGSNGVGAAPAGAE